MGLLVIFSSYEMRPWHVLYQGLALSLKAISTLDKDWEIFHNTGCSWQRVNVAECGEARKPDRKTMTAF